MSRFLNAAMSDIRSGRETWRVFVFLGSPAFLLAVATTLVH
jgi:hypothetical protein